MPSILIIENGTQVANANSYATAAEARAYASARGVTLSSVDATLEPQLVRACDFLDSLESSYKGSRVASAQALAWPRQNVFLFGSQAQFDIATIPSQLKAAQCQLACDITLGFDPQPTGNGREKLSSEIDVIKATYKATGVGVARPVLTKAMELLAPLLANAGLAIKTFRL